MKKEKNQQAMSYHAIGAFYLLSNLVSFDYLKAL